MFQWTRRKYCVLSLVACPGLQYFSKYFINVAFFEIKILIIKCVFWCSLQHCLQHVSLMWSKMYISIHVKYPLFSSYVNETWNFSTYFRKMPKYKTWWKSDQLEQSCYIRTVGHEEANSRFSQLCARAWKWPTFSGTDEGNAYRRIFP